MKKLPAEVYSRAEANALLAACSNRGAAGIRNRALIAVLYRCGLRISEALALKPADIDVDAGTVRVLLGKGAKARTVGIDRGTIALVEQWRAKRATLAIRPNVGPLFCTFSTHAKGTSMDPSYVRHLLPRLRAKAGISKRVHAHGFRHTHAVELLRERNTPVVIQNSLGHKSLGTTNTYLAHLFPREVIDVMREREW